MAAQKSNETANEIFSENFTNLPTDVQQRILSFDGFYLPRRVCKEWKLLSERNEIIRMRELYQSTIIPSPSSSSSRTLIVHPKRRHMHAVEINLGYKGPMGIEEALALSKDGDRLLIHDGKYKMKKELYIKRTVQLIGLGGNASFENVTRGHVNDSSAQVFQVYSKKKGLLSFENLSFLSSAQHFLEGCSCIILDADAKCDVSFKNCRFESMPFVAIRNHSSSVITIEKCTFDNVLCGVLQEVNPANINIHSSLFKRVGEPKAEVNFIHYDWNAILIHTSSIGSKLCCVGNTFEDCAMFPIVEDHININISGRVSYKVLEQSDLFVLKENVIKGNNKCNGQTFEANTAYEAYEP